MFPDKPLLSQAQLDALVNDCVAFTLKKGKVLYRANEDLRKILDGITVEYELGELLIWCCIEEYIGHEGTCIINVYDGNITVLRATGCHMIEAYNMVLHAYCPGSWERKIPTTSSARKM